MTRCRVTIILALYLAQPCFNDVYEHWMTSISTDHYMTLCCAIRCNPQKHKAPKHEMCRNVWGSVWVSAQYGAHVHDSVTARNSEAKASTNSTSFPWKTEFSVLTVHIVLHVWAASPRHFPWRGKLQTKFFCTRALRKIGNFCKVSASNTKLSAFYHTGKKFVDFSCA